jgi:chaperonin cofactor prefoldin
LTDNRYRCGAGFAEVSYDRATTLIRNEDERLQRRAADVRAKLEDLEGTLFALKKTLTSKFGDSIRLEM